MPCSKPYWPCLFVLLGLVCSAKSWCGEAVPAAYRFFAEQGSIPHSLFYAIALTESGKQIKPKGVYRPWPWTLNIAGRGYYFDSRLAAWRALTNSLRAGEQSIDIGLMQINWHYHHERLGSPWQALEPFHNLRVGARILQTCYATRKDWWASVGCYHSPSNPQRAEQYRRRVESRWQKIVSAG